MDLERRIEDWQGLLTRHVGSARQILAKLIPQRLVFTPQVDGRIPTRLPVRRDGAASSRCSRA